MSDGYSWLSQMCSVSALCRNRIDGGTVTLLSTTETTTAAPSTASDHGGGGDDNTQLAQAAASSLTDADSKKRSHEQMIDATVVAIPGNDITNVLPVAVTVDGKTETNEDHDRILELSERLDIFMNIIYECVVLVTTYEPDSLMSAMAAVVHARRLYRSHLENLFERKVRTTDRTKFVQFIFLVLFGRENKSLKEVGRLLAKREKEQQQRVVVTTSTTTTTTMEMVDTTDPERLGILATMPTSSDEPLYRGFIAKLIDYFYNPNYAGDVPRQTAALLRWAEVYISAQSDTVVAAVRVSGGGGSSSRGGGTTSHEHHRLSSSLSRMSLGGNTQHPCEMHALFYTCCQAAFYIFCFRGAEALTYHRRLCKQYTDDLDGGGYADPQSVDIGPERWQFLCEHPLQPLKYCLESVRLEFPTLAQDLNLFYVDHGDGGVARKDEATQFVNQLRINTSSHA
jgi:RNA polymerase I-specific transcription initiation factor RRN3